VVSGKTTARHVTPQPGARRPAPKAPAPRQSRSSAAAPPETADAGGAKSGFPWLAVVLLLVLGGVGGAIVVMRGGKPAPVPVAAAPAASPLLDSIAALQKAEATENAKLQQELDDARKTALAAERKVETLSETVRPPAPAAASAEKKTVAPAAPAEPPHAHIIVLARGGSPRVLVDGQPTVNSAPTVVEVPPGKHTVAVRGATGNVFTPAEYNLELAVGDTQQVVFVSQRAAQFQKLRQQQTGDSLRKVKRPN